MNPTCYSYLQGSLNVSFRQTMAVATMENTEGDTADPSKGGGTLCRVWHWELIKARVTWIRAIREHTEDCTV